MADEKTDTLGWHGGGRRALSGRICPREGKAGRDADQSGQGRIAFFPNNWPATISQDDSLFAHVMTAGAQGPHGETVHHDKLDGMSVSCTMMADGTPLIHHVWPSWSGPDPQDMSGATGPYTYPGAGEDKG